MNTLIKKQAILQSLDSMNDSEMERVLQYIKGLLYNETLDMDYLAFKRKAMEEINAALQPDKQLAV